LKMIEGAHIGINPAHRAMRIMIFQLE